MSEWAIVAIPEEYSSVWRYSSEKIPHMTLLYFGEQDDPEIARQIATQLQHTVNTSLTPFTAEVHSRGVLGDKSADVLFFDQAEIPKELLEFRSLLLKDETIRKCYDSVKQHPSWTPHLTMGYPDNPAKKPKDEFEPDRLYSVHFNRIALWVNDFDGPTFKLNYKYAYPDMEVTMSDETRAFLAHGISPAPPVHGSMVPPSNLRHHGFGKMSHSFRSRLEEVLPFALQSALAADSLQHGEIDVDDVRYILSHQSSLIESVTKAVSGRPSEGATRYDVATRPNGDWILSSIDLEARKGTAETCIRPVLSHSGEIVDYRIVPGNVPEEDLRYSLMHYGVKGMKWGRRRKSDDGGRASEGMSKRQQKKAAKAQDKADVSSAIDKASVSRKKSELDSIGENAAFNAKVKQTKRKDLWKRPVTPDAAISNARQKRAGTHGTDSLSNRDLQALVQRMSLEQQYATLKASGKSKSVRDSGKEYLADVLKTAGQELAVEAIKFMATEGFSRGKSSASNAYSRKRAQADIIPPFAIESPRRALNR